ncbi:hypothetical protein Glove_202g68 [Diversispora epigaea]|uniref:Uncharacterized protein n=1 Tax=Diversispora epigaea TaxID=1348612 RepID=A0A397IPK3_9GLOM|nr:hypothetical protein Glove_202g68 [Diversispora epigaea]
MALTFKTFILLFFVLVGLLTPTHAVPTPEDISDISSTSIGISETNNSRSEELVVSIQRVDDLVNAKGEIVAEKISAVIINFELNEDNVLTLNSVPVELGVNSIQTIEARIVPGDSTPEDIQKYEDNFDIGLVMVEVRSFIENISKESDGATVSKLTVFVKILELDGVQVVHTDAVERFVEFQLLEIKEGQNTELIPIEVASEETTVPIQPHRKPCPLLHWWKCSSKYTKIFIVSFAFTLLSCSFFLLLVPVAINKLKLPTKFNQYKKILQEEEFGDNEDLQVEQVIFIAEEEKHALVENDHNERE